jgi:hypothetical protein
MNRARCSAALATLSALVLSPTLAACGVSASGDFDGVAFVPGGSAFAVVDRHTLVPSGGSLIAVQRSDAQQRVHILLTGAITRIDDEWRHLSAQRLLSSKKDLATLDGLLLTDIPIARVDNGEDLEVQLDETGRRGDGEFGVELVVGLPAADRVADQGLGADVSVKILFDDVDVSQARGGHVGARVEIKRDRSTEQDGEVATGEVTLTFSAPVAPERVAKSNLSLAAPVMRCAATVGPEGAGRCRGEPPDPFADASGTLVEP